MDYLWFLNSLLEVVNNDYSIEKNDNKTIVLNFTSRT